VGGAPNIKRVTLFVGNFKFYSAYWPTNRSHDLIIKMEHKIVKGNCGYYKCFRCQTVGNFYFSGECLTEVEKQKAKTPKLGETKVLKKGKEPN